MNRNSVLYTVVFTFITAFFFVFFLALANNATTEKVEENKRIAVQKAVLSSLDILPSDEAQIEEIYSSRFDIIPTVGDQLETDLNGEAVLINYYSGSGLWGTITGVLAVDKNLNRIIGLEIISHNETPGLGGRIDEDWFKKQFRSEAILENGITVRKGSGEADSDTENAIIDGITGASQTSKSIERIVNTQLLKMKGGSSK